MRSHLKIALTAGGMYDRLNARIPDFERATGVTVAVEFAGTHPELNAHLAALDPVPYHLVSTHTKYAPSQLRFLAPIEGFDTSDFFPPVLDLARIGGALYGIPRNIDNLQIVNAKTATVIKVRVDPFTGGERLPVRNHVCVPFVVCCRRSKQGDDFSTCIIDDANVKVVCDPL